MTNYEAIKRMTMEQLEIFLDHVYLTGMNNALYLSRLTEDEVADFDYETYDHPWLVSEAEEATEYVFDDDGETYMPFYLVKAIYRNADIDVDELDPDQMGSVEVCGGIKFEIDIKESAPELDLDGMSLADLKVMLEDLVIRLTELEDSEPEDDESEEYELWDDAVSDLEDYIDQIEEAIEEFVSSDTD